MAPNEETSSRKSSSAAAAMASIRVSSVLRLKFIYSVGQTEATSTKTRVTQLNGQTTQSTSAPIATTATPTSATAAPTTASSSSTQQQSEINSFNSLKSGSSNSYTAGKVVAADESSSGVSILQSSEAGVGKTSSTQEQNDEADTSQKAGSDDTKQANTKSEATSAGTSPVIVALVVLAVVGGIALAAVAYTVKRKKLDDKRIDRNEAATRSFDTFSSPVRINSTIAKI
ncbi:Carbohydrate-binding protein [Phytophthora cinnamomi]|uniref:Carbohydrate-binding protein n=1 Tax=Phytophthora cinnamomi TaxID=4785 RepID=UPI00355A85CD|nr:Carbohydrate-binding protein [Phytophthora cinnamomi]